MPGRYRGRMSHAEKRHPVRILLLLALAAGFGVALRNAVADKGGSYDPDDGLTR